MLTCGQYKMMAPTSVMALPPATKPKIGFSIDSIVGSNNSIRNPGGPCSLSPRSEESERPSSPLSDCSYPLELRTNDSSRDPRVCSPEHLSSRINRMQQIISNDFHRNFMAKLPNSSPQHHNYHHQGSALSHLQHNSGRTTSTPPANSRLSPDSNNDKSTRSPSPPAAHNQHMSKGPIVVPGIPAGLIRPFPVQPPNLEMKTIPPYMNSPEVIGTPPNAHFLAAQFQMAAAIAQHGHQTSQGFVPGNGLPPHHPQFGNPNLVRESYPLYPWLLSRHGRLFPHRFPGNFLLQPFRKPKRVRTAFSPSQLLKLEHAFENNHYVVGAERKTLAQTLNLTETQVKVWFQNRRTKHKRMQQEEDAKGGGKGDNNDSDSKGMRDNNGSQASYDEDEDELIDMDDCPSDEENDLLP